MTPRGVAWTLAVLAVLTTLALLLGRGAPTGASAVSPAPTGWLAARRYVEARGVDVELRTRPLDDGGLPDVLVVAFGASRRVSEAEHAALRAFLHRGGVLVLGYSGTGLAVLEGLTLEAIDVDLRSVSRRPPLTPRAWRAWADREWALQPDDALGPGVLDLRLRAPRFVPHASPTARVLYRSPEGHPVVFEERRGAGTIVLLPSEVLANQRIAEPGHADLLEALLQQHPGRWEFDEYVHGLGGVTTEAGRHAAATFDAFVLQLLLLYGAALLALARRFGPPWSDPPVQAASTAAFLRGLGAQHDRRGHHAAAAARLSARAAALHPRLRFPSGHDVRDARALLAFARHVAGIQGGRSHE